MYYRQPGHHVRPDTSMKLLQIDQNELHALMNEKSDVIGTNWFAELVNLSGGISLLLTTIFGINILWIQIITGILSIVIIAVGIYRLIKGLKKSENAQKLYKEITQLDKVERRSSIVAIKDTYQQHPHRYLLYHDDGWNCDFFPNHKTIEGIKHNMSSLLDHLSSELEIDRDDIELHYIRDDMNEKPSTEHNGEMRLYIYSLYSAVIHNIPSYWQQDEFEIAGRRYKWMSTDGMLTDARIRDVNSDVVSLVRDYLP